jgi:hypothetical protein
MTPDRTVSPTTVPPLPPDRPPASAPLRISFLGFNPLGGGYDGRGKIDVGADRTFASLDGLDALRLIRKHLHDRPVVRGPLDLRITGYSFGGWTALQVAHAVCRPGGRVRVRIGLVDPVCTFRSRRAWRVARWAARLPAGWSLPLLSLAAGPAYATRPACVVRAVNYFQTKGLICRFGGDGFRLPYRATWFASQPVDGFDNYDVSADVTAGGGHIEVAERHARTVADATFADDGM